MNSVTRSPGSYRKRTASWDATSGGNQLQSITLGTTGGATNNQIPTVSVSVTRKTQPGTVLSRKLMRLGWTRNGERAILLWPIISRYGVGLGMCSSTSIDRCSLSPKSDHLMVSVGSNSIAAGNRD